MMIRSFSRRTGIGFRHQTSLCMREKVLLTSRARPPNEIAFFRHSHWEIFDNHDERFVNQFFRQRNADAKRLLGLIGVPFIEASCVAEVHAPNLWGPEMFSLRQLRIWIVWHSSWMCFSGIWISARRGWLDPDFVENKSNPDFLREWTGITSK